MKTKYLLYTGIITPLVFFTTTIVCGILMGGYNHFSRLVSELGAIGTKTQNIFSIGLILCSILSVLLVISLYKPCKRVGLNVLPILFIFSFTISIAGTAIFPLPLRLHLIMGMPSILLVLSPLLSLILWKNQTSHFKKMTTICLIIMSLGFLSFFPSFLSNYAGLKQRFFHIGWSIWFIYLSIHFNRLNKIEKQNISN